MKKILLIFGLLLFSCSFCQDLDSEESLIKSRLKVDSLNTVLISEKIYDENLVFLLEARNLIAQTVDNILKLDDFKNTTMQKVLIKPLTDYYDAFNYTSEGKNYNSLRYGFKEKNEFLERYRLVEAILLAKIKRKQYDLLIKKSEEFLAKYEIYLTRNLKRLGMTRAQFDALSDNDVEILEKQFE